MLRGLTLILLFQFAGMALELVPGMPLPGAISGMVLFFLYLVVTDGGGEAEQRTAETLLRHLPLFFIPAGAGIITLTAILQQQALGIFLALTLGTLLAFILTAWLMQRLSGGHRGKHNEGGGHD